MNMLWLRFRTPVTRLAVFFSVFFALYAAIHWLLPLVAPFVTAMIIASMNEPLIRLMMKRLKMKRKFAATAALLLDVLAISLLIFLCVSKIYDEIQILQQNLSHYSDSFLAMFSQWVDHLQTYYQNLPYGIPAAIEENLRTLAPRAQVLISGTINTVISTLSSLPRVLVFVIMTLLATFFISSDKDHINAFVSRQVPEQWHPRVSGAKKTFLSALGGYIKAQGILLSLTFLEVLTGLLILRQDYAFVLALLVCLSDMIPIFGTTLVFAPWILFTLITGNLPLALGLSVIYVAGVAMRQILEPKLIGDQLGMHPLVSLLAIYLGLTLYGILGMLIALMAVVILMNIQKSGVVELWKD